jgi:hypothetical protein
MSRTPPSKRAKISHLRHWQRRVARGAPTEEQSLFAIIGQSALTVSSDFAIESLNTKSVNSISVPHEKFISWISVGQSHRADGYRCYSGPAFLFGNSSTRRRSGFNRGTGLSDRRVGIGSPSISSDRRSKSADNLAGTRHSVDRKRAFGTSGVHIRSCQVV